MTVLGVREGTLYEFNPNFDLTLGEISKSYN